MDEYIIIRGNSKESQALRWLQKARSKDPERVALTGFFVTDHGVTLTTDGFRVHAIQTPRSLQFQIPEDESKILAGKIPAGNFIAVMEEIAGSTFPDYRKAIPAGDPDFTVCVNAAFLIDALQGMEKGKPVYIRVFNVMDGSSYNPIEVIQPHTNRYAIIMSMYHRHSKKDLWRPFEPVQEEEDKKE